MFEFELEEIEKKIYTVNELTKELKTTQPNVSYHLSSLLESGLLLYEDIGGKRYYFKSLE